MCILKFESTVLHHRKDGNNTLESGIWLNMKKLRVTLNAIIHLYFGYILSIINLGKIEQNLGKIEINIYIFELEFNYTLWAITLQQMHAFGYNAPTD